ncbi:MAG: type IX secretion system protein PorQ [Candidatus Cyclobacteriaceae bacterium M2_1C_046]
MTKLTLIIILKVGLMFLSPALLAQEVTGTYQFLNVAPDASVMAMGGINTSWTGLEPGSFINNPALSADSLHNYAGFNYLAYSRAYHMASVFYHYKIPAGGLLSGGIRHFTTGEMHGFDPAGNPTGTFSSAQTAVTIGYSMGYNNFRYGVNISFINSGIAAFQSNALSFTLGGIFKHPEKDLSVGASIHNVGFLINDFTSTSDSHLPWDARIGVTFKPEHMPFRFSMTGHHLFNYDLLSDEISTSNFKEVMAHIVIGTELVLSRSISIFAGYNHLVRQELKLQQLSGGAGFSYGFKWQTNTFQFGYGRGAYHIAGAAHMLSLNMNMNRIFG